MTRSADSAIRKGPSNFCSIEPHRIPTLRAPGLDSIRTTPRPGAHLVATLSEPWLDPVRTSSRLGA